MRAKTPHVKCPEILCATSCQHVDVLYHYELVYIYELPEKYSVIITNIKLSTNRENELYLKFPALHPEIGYESHLQFLRSTLSLFHI